MKLSGITFLFCLITFFIQTFAQTGSLQIYCMSDVNIYINDKLAGRTSAEMSGLFVENIPTGEVNVRAYRQGYSTETAVVTIEKGKITEFRFEMQKSVFQREKYTGLMLHFGTFGLFNVNNVFTKALYSFGFTPHFDIRIHNHFAAGVEVMTMWGKPETDDQPRLMLNPNLRFRAMFSPAKNIRIEILIASGFAWWPENQNIAHLTSGFNDNRTGWDFRAVAGVEYVFTEKTAFNLNFGYWASSSTSDNIIWITHDTMLISFGPVFKL